MNKKLFLGMFAAAGMLLATSCQNDEELGVQSGNEAQVSFSLGLEGNITTRTISDGTKAKKLVYAVYNANEEIIETIDGANDNGQIVNENAFSEGLNETVSITLAKGQTYTVVFWAQNSECEAYTTKNLKNVTVNYEDGKNNDETRDAFFAAKEFTASGDEPMDVTLRRPFAQINVGVSEKDREDAEASGIEITQSKAVIKGVANSINLLDGSVSGEVDVTYDFEDIPDEKLAVGDTDYTYLSMSYILTGNEKNTLEDLQFTFKPENGTDIVFDEGLDNVPVQRNWRTNIVGTLLTGNVEFNITIEPGYLGDYDYPEFETVADGVSLDNANSTYYLSSKEGLQWFAKQTNEETNSFKGYTVKLGADVDLAGETWTPIGTTTPFRGTFDGGNNTISNLKVEVTGDKNYAGLFAQARGVVKDVILKDVDIQGEFMSGAIVGNATCSKIENCHVEGGTITSTPDSNNDNGNNVGGIAGYLYASPEAWVKDCTVKNLTVTAYRNVGGIVGRTVGASEISGNTIYNVTVIADQLVEYKEDQKSKADDPGKVLGNNYNNQAVVMNNTVNNVTCKRYYVKDDGIALVGTGTGLKYAAENGATEITLDNDVTVDINANTKLSDEALTIDGKNKTLCFNQTNSDYSNIDMGENATLTIKNATLKSEGYNTGYWGRLGIYFLCKVNLENVTSRPIILSGNSELKNVTINNTDNAYSIWIRALGQTVTMKDLTINTTGSESRAIAIKDENIEDAKKVTLNLSDAIITSSKKAAILVSSTAGANITLTNVDISGVAVDNTNGVWVDEDYSQYNDKVSVTGGNKIVEGSN